MRYKEKYATSRKKSHPRSAIAAWARMPVTLDLRHFLFRRDILLPQEAGESPWEALIACSSRMHSVLLAI
jgi:hypothetical protein